MAAGRVPAGVRPFKVAVDIPELDQIIDPSFMTLELKVDSTTTWRQLREKLHYFSISTSKRIDSRVTGLQLATLLIVHSSGDLGNEFSGAL